MGEGEASYQRQVENRENIRKGIADLVTVKRRMALRQEQLGERVGDFDAQAREAMSAGREGCDPFPDWLPELPEPHAWQTFD